MRHIILGTAGHIDHGKSSLVKALTGIDPDRLKEEKERGITIDIGFADLVYPDSALTVGIVDVPGHERLIRNMLAGAGGIDIVLMVIAADEGIMPQSHEHLAICDLLNIKSGLIAVTKSDLVEKDWLALVEDEVRGFIKGSFLEDAPVIPVSARTGENLEFLKEKIKSIALQITPKSPGGLFRLPIDRVFTLKGFGTVVTGTAVSGTVSTDDPIEILPSDIRTKVRGLHSHGKPIKTAYAGQRVAINLQGVEKEELKRGDVVLTPSRFYTTKTVDVFLRVLPDTPVLKNKSLVHFYSGTAETIARVILYGKEELKASEAAFCQLRLQNPVIAASGDRYIIRRFSPLETLGGGEILDPSPGKRRRKEGLEDLEILHQGDLKEKIALKVEKSGTSGISVDSLEGWIKAEKKDIKDALGALEKTGNIMRYEDILIHKNSFSSMRDKVIDYLQSFHRKNPLKAGMAKEEMRTHLKIESRLFNFILTHMGEISVDKNLVRLREFRAALSGSEEISKTKILELLEQGGFQPPAREEMASVLKMEQKHITDILGMMAKEGLIIRINESVYLSGNHYKAMISILKDFSLKKNDITVAEFRDLLNTTRKYALPFLEHLDSNKITFRTGDVRKFLFKD